MDRKIPSNDIDYQNRKNLSQKKCIETLQYNVFQMNNEFTKQTDEKGGGGCPEPSVPHGSAE